MKISIQVYKSETLTPFLTQLYIHAQQIKRYWKCQLYSNNLDLESFK